MLVIPAIDLKDGKCVRLRQGRMDEVTHFSDDPVAMAGRWLSLGARRLHLVDLNGAFAGQPVNGEVIRAIATQYPDLPLEVGGGIRDLATIEAYLQAGVRYVIIGTQAIRQPEFVTQACRAFPERVILGLDAKDGWIATQGWAEITQFQVIDWSRRFADDGVQAIIYTDIGRDGMMTGPNLEATRALAEAISIPVIASGGVSRIEDIQALRALAECGVMGVITGRAIYEGTLDFAAAQKLADGYGVVHGAG